MAVDPRWLESVRAQKRRQLGIGGMGAPADMLGPFVPQAPQQIRLTPPPPERPWIKKLLYAGAALATLGVVGAVAVTLWPSKEKRA